MPANSFPIEKRGAFNLDEATIKAVVNSVEKFTEASYSISATFDDDFTHNTKDIDTLLTHPHFRSSSCRSISISSTTTYTQSSSKDIRVSCSKWVNEGRFKADISSDNDDLHIVRNDIDREIKASREKYDILYRIPSGIWFVLFCVLGLLLGIKLGNTLTAASRDQSRDALSNLFSISLVITIIPTFMLLYVLSKLKLVVYPCFTVEIGKAKERRAVLADTRKWAYRAIAAAVVGYIIKLAAFPS